MQSVDCNKLEVVNRHHARRDLYRTAGPEADQPPSTFPDTDNWMRWFTGPQLCKRNWRGGLVSKRTRERGGEVAWGQSEETEGEQMQSQIQEMWEEEGTHEGARRGCRRGQGLLLNVILFILSVSIQGANSPASLPQWFLICALSRGESGGGGSLQSPVSTGLQEPSGVAVIITACVIASHESLLTQYVTFIAWIPPVVAPPEGHIELRGRHDWINYCGESKGRFSFHRGVCVWVCHGGLCWSWCSVLKGQTAVASCHVPQTHSCVVGVLSPSMHL